MNTKLLTVKEVAAALGISTRQVWRMRDAGLLPQPLRFGRCVRWGAMDIEAWIEDGCPACTPRRSGGRAPR